MRTSPSTPVSQRLLAISPGKALFLLLCIWLLCFIIISVANGFIMYRFPESSKAMRICAVFQDLMVFIVPSLVTAMLATRLPANLLALNTKTRFDTIFLAFATLMVAMPALNLVIYLNMQMKLPEALSGIEHWMTQAEKGAAENIGLVLGGAGIGDLILSFLLVGVLAGFSEELFFRGALQRIIAQSRISPHAAIWIAAFIFSAIHLQFYGFFPRLLLGVYFGYLLYWSGSLWLPVFAHISNNSVYVIYRWIQLQHSSVPVTENTLPEIDLTFYIAAAISLVFTIVGLYLVRRSATSGKNLFLKK